LNASQDALAILYSFLPPQPRAWSLCETYYEHAAWFFNPIKRDELINDILSPVYKSLKAQRDSGMDSTPQISPHQLAVLYIVFALGTLTDLTLPPLHSEAKTYFHLSKAALSCRSVLDSPEVSTVRALTLMAAYLNFGVSNTMHSAWAMASLGVRLGQSVCTT
jgi:hypothetical protein